MANRIEGENAPGSTADSYPVLVAGADVGNTTRTLLLDASGRPIMVGAGGDGLSVVGNPVRVAGSDGAATRSLLTDSSGRLFVNINSTSGTANIQGVDAHDAPITANPVTIGGRASQAVPTMVSADGDAIRGWYDPLGRMIVQQHVPVEVPSATRGPVALAPVVAANTETTLIAAPGAGLCLVIVEFILTETSNQVVNFQLRQGTGAANTRVRGVARRDSHFFQTTFGGVPWKLPDDTALIFLSSVGLTATNQGLITIQYYVCP